MKKEEKKQFIRYCILGAIGGILMAAGDWLLGCVPLQETDTGMFNRAYYLSGFYDLWKPALVVGMGAIGCFLYSFIPVRNHESDCWTFLDARSGKVLLESAFTTYLSAADGERIFYLAGSACGARSVSLSSTCGCSLTLR